MGTLYQFSCPNCGYQAEVSGGTDFGMTVTTNTIICKTCQELYDAVISDKPWLVMEDDRTPISYTCPKSKRHVVEFWFILGEKVKNIKDFMEEMTRKKMSIGLGDQEPESFGTDPGGL